MGYTMQSAVAVTTAVQVPRVRRQGCSLVQDIGDGQRTLPGMFMVTSLAGCSDLLLASINCKVLGILQFEFVTTSSVMS
jgi:hypothetical protein